MERIERELEIERNRETDTICEIGRWKAFGCYCDVLGLSVIVSVEGI